MERVGVVLVQPVVTVKEEELLAPKHAGDGLAHHPGRVFTHRWRRDRLVKLIGFTQAVSEEFIKLLTEGFVFNVWGTLGEAQANHFALTGAYIDPVVRRDLGALLSGVYRALLALHHAVVDAVLDVGALVLLPGEKQFVVCFVFGEEQRHIAFAGKDVFAQQRMCGRDRARARSRLDLLEDWFLGSPVGCGNPRRPVIAEPECRQQMQFCRPRSPVGGRDPHQDVFRALFGILHKNVEIPVAIEYACVEEFILHVATVAPLVCPDQIRVGKCRLRVLVEVLHVGMSRRAVEVEVVLLHILSVVALAVAQSEEPLLENRVLAVPHGQREAQVLFVIGNAGNAVLPPAVGT